MAASNKQTPCKRLKRLLCIKRQLCHAPKEQNLIGFALDNLLHKPSGKKMTNCHWGNCLGGKVSPVGMIKQKASRKIIIILWKCFGHSRRNFSLRITKLSSASQGVKPEGECQQGGHASSRDSCHLEILLGQQADRLWGPWYLHVVSLARQVPA